MRHTQVLAVGGSTWVSHWNNAVLVATRVTKGCLVLSITILSSSFLDVLFHVTDTSCVLQTHTHEAVWWWHVEGDDTLACLSGSFLTPRFCVGALSISTGAEAAVARGDAGASFTSTPDVRQHLSPAICITHTHRFAVACESVCALSPTGSCSSSDLLTSETLVCAVVVVSLTL